MLKKFILNITMNVGLFFGSFNPVHNGHLIIASHISQYTGLDEVWFIVSPQNPFKKTGSLLNENHRYFLLKAAVENEKKIKVSNVEFRLPKPSYTADTLVYLREAYPQDDFTIIIGSDSYHNINNWKNSFYILENFEIFVYNRPGFILQETFNIKHKVIEAPLLEISSTEIRKMIRAGKSVRFWVPDVVYEEIEKNLYYRSYSENPT